MRLSLLALIPIAASLFTYVSAHYDDAFEGREYVDEVVVTRSFHDFLEHREALAGITSRELLDELSERLERREYVKCLGCGKDIGEGHWAQTIGLWAHNRKCPRIHQEKVEGLRRKLAVPLTPIPTRAVPLSLAPPGPTNK
ncbi:hypothetical protein DFP72DRAFT_855379 [Ephemerocybe angulata]|uniref:C2H2-type domain-containing protein n=1 Tax=Ephemerocybe angulata TaxID=980116 RepID=A0A8H6LYA0_9AGAR|nr:hypothetical protein DFP72DRAFT_855379 [Tulosesus angulatus]